MASVWVKTSAMEVHRLELDVRGVVLVQPRLVLGCLSRVSVIEDARIWLLLECHRTLHALDDFLSPVTMMNIKIYNRDLFDLLSVHIFQVCRCDGHVVDVAESVGLLLVANVLLKGLSKDSCVVAGGSDSTKGIVYFSV